MRRGSPNRNFSTFMAGRYGADALGRFLSICGCVCILLSVAVRGKSAFFSAVFSCRDLRKMALTLALSSRMLKGFVK